MSLVPHRRYLTVAPALLCQGHSELEVGVLNTVVEQTVDPQAAPPLASRWTRYRLSERVLPELALFSAVLATFLIAEPGGGAALASVPAFLICLLSRHFSALTLPWAVGGAMRASLSAVLAALMIAAESALVPGGQIELSIVFAVAGAACAASLLAEYRRRPARALIVGGGEGLHDLISAASRDPGQLEIVATVGSIDDSCDRGAIRGYSSISDLDAALDEHRPDLVIVNVESGRLPVFQALLEHAGSGFRVVGLPEVYEHAFGRVPIAQLSAAWFMSLIHLYQRAYAVFAKRTFDVLVASVGLLLTLPIFALFVVLVRRPVFYGQVRVGEGGRTFTMYKFRSMCVGAENETGPVFAETDDPRVTRTGCFLRKTRLDELPQLWNVLIGDMSIVGPRPERPEFSSLLASVPWWVRRNMVKPGITGWAQVNSPYANDAEGAAVKLSYDLWYLRHGSLLMDVVICLKTLPRLVTGIGAR